MLHPDIMAIKNHICTHLGEVKGLDEWVQICNEVLPDKRRKTPREMGQIFKTLRMKGMVQVERKSYPTIYTFYSTDSVIV